MLNENDFLYAIDSDVIAHNYEGDWQWNNEDIYDLIFFERFWNGEVVAGKVHIFWEGHNRSCGIKWHKGKSGMF